MARAKPAAEIRPPKKADAPAVARAPLKIEYLALDAVVPDAKNARTHSAEQVAQIAAAIGEWGFTNPLLIDEQRAIIAGHGRLEAARKVGLAEVPTITLAGLSPTQKRALMLADNKLALNAGWDAALLRAELGELKLGGFDLALAGFNAVELKSLLAPAAGAGQGDPDGAPALQERAVSALGDVWVLGRHRVACGSATAADDVARLLGDDQLDLVWTDPPYNVAYEGKAGTIANDDMPDAQFAQFLADAFTNYWMSMRPGACIYVAHADSKGHLFRQAMIAADIPVRQCLIWVKQSAPLSRQDYNWKHEPILYGWKDGAGHYFCGDHTKTTVLEESADPAKLPKERLVALVAELRAQVKTTVLRHERPAKSELHPTMKPVALVKEMVENSSRPGDTVADFFGGSGTTLIACEASGRNARLLELDPRYVDVIVKRWQEYSGETAILADDGRTWAEIAAERA